MPTFNAQHEAQTFVFDYLERGKGLVMTHEFKMFLLDEIEKLLDRVVEDAVAEAVEEAEGEKDDKAEKEVEELITAIREEGPKIIHKAITKVREHVLAEKRAPNIAAITAEANAAIEAICEGHDNVNEATK